jgi:UDP-N-acetylbacillosamine N-acetyltransferase
MQRKVIIFGCGGHARSVLDVLFIAMPQVSIRLIDPNAEPREIVMGCSVLRHLDVLDASCFFAIGRSDLRQTLFQQYKGASLISILSPKAHIGYASSIGEGVFVGHGAHVGPEVKIGLCSIVNTGAIVEHEVVIGEFSHIAPGCTIAGRCKIGSRTMVGAGSVVRDGIEIGSDITVGAGAVVVANLFEPGVYVGCPAKKNKAGL